MLFKNTNQTYGWIAIFNHWVTAAVVFFMFGLGLYMVDLTYYDANYRSSLALHKSLGLSLAIFYVFRICWRFLNKQPNDLPGQCWEQLAAKLAHLSLYVMLLLLFISGYLISTADGRGIYVFDLFTVPSMGEFVEQQEDVAGEIHECLAWLLMITVVIHLLAAFKHQFVNRDNGLLRMIKPIKSSGENNE